MASLNSLLLPNNNYFLFQSTKIESILKEKGIGLATAKKDFPKTIEIKFPQNEPWLLYCSELDCYYVSDKGFLIDRAPKFSQNPLPEIIVGERNAKIGDQIATGKQIIFLRNTLQTLAKLNIQVTSVSFGEKSEVTIVTSENWYLRMTDNMNIQVSLNDLRLLLEQKIKENRQNLDYIDMRYPNKAYYKLR